MAKKAGATVTPIRPGVVAEKYPLDARFAQSFVSVFVRDGRLFRRFCKELDPKAFDDPRATNLVAAAQAFYLRTKRAPTTLDAVLQSLRLQVDEGKLSFDDMDAASEYIFEADARGLPTHEELVDLMLPVIDQRLASAAAMAAIEGMPTRDAKRVKKVIARWDDVRAGEAVPELGADFDESLGEREIFAKIPKIPFGVPDLDGVLGGGVPDGIFGLIVAGTNVGKGVSLVHRGSSAIQVGRFVLHASLEDPTELIFSRYSANLIGVPEELTRADPARANRLIRENFPPLPLRVKYFEPLKTSMKQIEEWVDQEETRAGRKCDELIIDYADRLAEEKKAIEYEGKSYAKFEAIYARIGIYARNEGGLGHKAGPIMVWTASASKAAGGGGGIRNAKSARERPITAEAVADSQHKSRIAWFVLTLDAIREEADADWMLSVHVGKNRLGKRGQTVEIYPDFECIRLCHKPKIPGLVW